MDVFNATELFASKMVSTISCMLEIVHHNYKNFFSQDNHGEFPGSSWLGLSTFSKRTEMCSVSFGGGTLRSRCQQGGFLVCGLRESLLGALSRPAARASRPRGRACHAGQQAAAPWLWLPCSSLSSSLRGLPLRVSLSQTGFRAPCKSKMISSQDPSL